MRGKETLAGLIGSLAASQALGHTALRLSIACVCREAAALSRIEKRLEEWRKIHVEAQEGGQSNPALVQLGQRIARLNAATKYVASPPCEATPC